MTYSSLTFVLFWLLCATNIPPIAIWMGQSAGLKFNITAFKACNTSGILCLNDTAVSGHVIQLTDSTTAKYNLTNQTAGRLIYNETIRLSSIASFTTNFQFFMRFYNLSFADQGGGGGIAFFITSKDIATIPSSAGLYSGLPGNGSRLSAEMVAVEFYNNGNCSRVYTEVGGYKPDQEYNHTGLDQRLNNGRLWNAWIDYNALTQYLEIFLSNTSSGSKSQRNRVFAHPIDFFKYLPQYVVVGLSASARNSSETHTILSWSFNSKTKPRKTSKRLIILSVVALVFCFAAAGVICGYYFFIVKKNRSGTSGGETCEDNEMEIDKLVEHGPRRYKLDDLTAGTNNFCETQKLGQGGFGGVYKGIVGEANEVVAVKRISEGSRQGIKEFISEVSIVSRVRHRNLVQLLGWCHERGQLLLVYEYMPNGSLDKHLLIKGDNPSLQWTSRYRIARQIASGLLYLHEEWDRCVVHRDVKSSNVMLDCDFNAKLGDFGLARILEHDRLCQTTMAAGTLGYLAPECVITGRTSPESDVYSFGALALEIATGRRAVDISLEEHNMRLVEWVWDLYGQGKLLEAADVNLNGEFNRAEMEQLTAVGLWCSHPDAAARPKMTQVVKLLNMEAQVPRLPPAIPVPTYAAFQGSKLSVASSYVTGSSYADAVLSSFSHSTSSTSAPSISAGIPGSSNQVSSSPNSSTLLNTAHFQQEEKTL